MISIVNKCVKLKSKLQLKRFVVLKYVIYLGVSTTVETDHVMNLISAFILEASCFLRMIFLGSSVDPLGQSRMGISWVTFPSMGRKWVSMSTFDKM